MIRGLDHVNISTAKLAETKAFFIEVLGLEEGWRPPLSFDGAWLYAGGRDVVHLAEQDEAPRPSRGSSLDHFAFAIDDYDEAVRRLEAAGVPYRRLEAPAGGIRQLFIADLNGTTIELNWRPG
ncbi:MAG: glyoxalase/bleomycin resistance protein/dioxygenase [Phenylobacterium sp.]|nr:glyoxalase/bleomycin resistance protein/dioxygenase [Phenylobacterium sp.]